MWHASVNHDVEAYQIKSKSLVLKLWVASPFQYKRQHACSDLWGPCDLTPHCFCDQLSHYFFCLRFQEQHATSCSSVLYLYTTLFSPETPHGELPTSFTSLLSYILIVSLVAVVSLLNTSTYSGQLLAAKDDSKQYGLKQCPDSSA